MGMVVITEGSATQDRVCGPPANTYQPATTSNPTTSPEPASTSKPSTTSNASPTSNPRTDFPSSVHTSTEPDAKLIASTPAKRPATAQDLPQQHPRNAFTTLYFLSSQNKTTHPPTASGNISPSNNPTWVIWLVLMLPFVMLTCLCLWCKGKNLKDKLEWQGLVFGKYHLQHLQRQQQAPSPVCSDVESALPVGSDGMDSTQSQGVGPRVCSGGNLQVTVGHNGHGESISNTVGSIFIYSPRNVILGSSSKDRTEEAEENTEKNPLISMPQQESSTHIQDDAVGVGMQEEFGKDLSFPVPATGK